MNLAKLFSATKPRGRKDMMLRAGEDEPVVIEQPQIGTQIDARPLEQLPTNPGVANQPLAEMPPTRDEIESENHLRQVEPSADRAGKLYPNSSLPAQANAGELQSAISELETADMGREHSLKNRLLSGLWKGVKAWAANGGQGGLVGLAGATLTGGVGSAASPNFHGEMRRDDMKNQLFQRLGQQQKQEEWQTGQDYKKAQTENIFADNELNRERAEQTKTDKEERRQLTLRNQLMAQIYHQKFYKKGNASFDKQLADAGIEMEDFDGRARKTRQVNGTLEQLNPDTNTWEKATGASVQFDQVPINAKVGGMPMQMTGKQLSGLLFQQGMNAYNQNQQNWRFQTGQEQTNQRQRRQIDAQLYSKAMTDAQKYLQENGIAPTRETLEDYFMKTYGYIPTK